MRKGFTVIEILVVVGVLTIMSVIFVEIFFRSLRGGNQAQILGVIKQNGQHAMEIMDKNIRLADDVVCVSSQGGAFDNNTLVIKKEKTYTRFIFVPPTTTTNGYILQDNIDNCILPSIASVAIILTNTDPTGGVSLISGSFAKDTKAGFQDIVIIKFTLGPGIKMPKSLTDNIEPLEFKTSVGLR